MSYKPALLVVDVQEDFSPPNGSLPVPSARSILDPVNTLLTYPFPLKLATLDWHPESHISFASDLSPLRNQITYPSVIPALQITALCSIHCVQDSHGAQMLPGLHAHLLHHVVKKGQDPRVEMYSAFYDPFRLSDSGIAEMLRTQRVTHVFVVGLAADFCVKASAIDARREGYETFIVEDGTKPVDPERWPEVRREIEAEGVRIVGMDSDEVDRVRKLAS
ncbi:hypothetical protein jhhlp_005242 [Lomentospora prolificans]|uniref:nicotinamidase n=1 Tax=Lomentospora prolificans TaxID=41688 RepID=A0A2N3N789_9PEZI|nr:hypothetical protein jhhlp_005242 [Lomentospora prolificans]